MSSFDLSEALDGPLASTSSRSDEETVTFELNEDLSLIVSYNPVSMRSVANMVLSVVKFKKLSGLLDSDHQGDELCSAILEQVLDESTHTSFSERRLCFQRSESWREFTLSDLNKKFIVKCNRQIKLKAILLSSRQQSINYKFVMRRYVPSKSSSCRGLTVLLSIGDLRVSCSKSDDQVFLNLEKCNDEELGEIYADDNMSRFLFHKQVSNVNHITFESVKYPGWFISTDSEEQVEMCRVDGSRSSHLFNETG